MGQRKAWLLVKATLQGGPSRAREAPTAPRGWEGPAEAGTVAASMSDQLMSLFLNFGLAWQRGSICHSLRAWSSYQENLTVCKGKTWSSSDAGDAADLSISGALGGWLREGEEEVMGELHRGSLYLSFLFKWNVK